MSTWTNEMHEAARARCEAATEGPWAPWLDQDGADHMNGLLMVGNADAVIPDGTRWVEGIDVNPIAHTYTPEDREFIAHARTDIPALLDEIERLRAESARRMVWLEREQKAHEQTRLALIDMTEQAAKPEVNDEMVERAARQVWGGVALFRDPDTLPSADSTDAGEAGMGRRYRRVARAALEAALTTKENEA